MLLGLDHIQFMIQLVLSLIDKYVHNQSTCNLACESEDVHCMIVCHQYNGAYVDTCDLCHYLFQCRVELEGEEFHKHLQPFLLSRTSHFLHEFVSFARSPFNMAAYDHRVRYEWPLSRVRDDWDPEATVNVTTEQLQHSPRPGMAMKQW